MAQEKKLYTTDYLERLQKSQAALNSHLETRPGEYQSKYQGQIEKAMEAIAGRKPFQYDVNGDALYQQYKNRYTQMGKKAMQDTMGQAAALTGGYGSSYAQNVGQQAYGSYMQGLTDKIPELYQLALSKYEQDAQAEKDRYSLYKDADATDYSRWSDKLSQWNTDRNYLAGRADTELSQAMTAGNTLYARLAQLAATGYTPTDEELQIAGMTRAQWDAMRPQVAESSGGGGGDGGGYSGGYSGGGTAAAASKKPKTLEEQYADMASNGATQKELYYFAQEAKQNGATASDIRNWSTKYMHSYSGKK